MSVRTINDRALWDDFVEKSPYGLLFHKWNFLKIMEKYSSMQLLPYGIYKGEELICLFPLFFKRANGLKILYSPPMQVLLYVPYQGFLMSQAFAGFKQLKKEKYLEAVVHDIGRETAKLYPNFISISAPPGFIDVRAFAWTGYHVRNKYNYVTDLRGPLDDLWNGLDKTLRSDIRSMDKRSGSLVIKRSGDVATLFNNMQEKLAPYGQTFFHTQSPGYLRDLMAAFPDNIRMYNLYNDDVLVSQSVMLAFKDRVMGWMGGTSLRKDEGPYTEYMTWEMMKISKAEGYGAFVNWGGDDRRLCSFKAKFNAELEHYYVLEKKDAFGAFAGWAFFKALELPVVKTLLLKEF